MDVHMDGRTDAHAMTIARWPSASGAKNQIQEIASIGVQVDKT